MDIELQPMVIRSKKIHTLLELAKVMRLYWWSKDEGLIGLMKSWQGFYGNDWWKMRSKWRR
jgi:hypothetical protein